MGPVRQLTPHEAVCQDVEAIAEIYRNLGAPVAEQLVTRAFGEVALTTASIAEKVRTRDLRELRPQLLRLRRLAQEIGLRSLATVAGDAETCLRQADSTAFSAVWARLMRVAGLTLALEPGPPDRCD